MNSEKTKQGRGKKNFFSLSAGVAFGGVLILLSATGVLSPFGISYTCPGLGTATSLSQHLKVQDDLSLLVARKITIDSNYKLRGMNFDIGPDREIISVEHSDGNDYYIDGSLVSTGRGPEDLQPYRFNKGHNEFSITYLAENEISIQDNRARFVWDITSDRQTIANERVSFSMELPESIKASDVEVQVLRRSITSCEENLTGSVYVRRSNAGNRLLFTADSLNEREMLRAHISWPVDGEPEGLI